MPCCNSQRCTQGFQDWEARHRLPAKTGNTAYPKSRSAPWPCPLWSTAFPLFLHSSPHSHLDYVSLFLSFHNVQVERTSSMLLQSCSSACIAASSALHSSSPHLSFSFDPLQSSQHFAYPCHFELLFHGSGRQLHFAAMGTWSSYDCWPFSSMSPLFISAPHTQESTQDSREHTMLIKPCFEFPW